MIHQNEFDIDGDTIREILEGIANDLGAELLNIIAGIFSVFWGFTVDIMAGYFLSDNPAVLLIALSFFITAIFIWMKK